MPPLARLRQRLRGLFSATDNATRIFRRRTLTSKLYERLPRWKLVLFFAGYLWMLVVPASFLGEETYIDENALQPAQVNTYWNWADVNRADQYLTQLEALHSRNASSEERADYIVSEFRRLGISASAQRYSYRTSFGTINGTNAYAAAPSPRASGTEAMVVSASWTSSISDKLDAPNLRGVASVLALASFLTRYSLWAKDLVFVVSDGYMDGMHAWLNSYHHVAQSNLEAESLSLAPGVIWNALNIDYPGHSFSHLGIFYEGLNGRLPNQDLINSFERISRYTGGVPVVVHDHTDPRESSDRPSQERSDIPSWLSWLPSSVRENHEVQEYAYRAKNIGRHVGYQARGQASGLHGLFHEFRIDAITMFAVPAEGPHGFHAIGKAVESTLRTCNNLLERLHASFFFFLLVTQWRFLKIGSYLPSAVLVSVAMMFGGLWQYVDVAWTRVSHASVQGGKEVKWVKRRRPILPALVIVIISHAIGTALFFAVSSSWFLSHRPLTTNTALAICAALPVIATSTTLGSTPERAPVSGLVKSLNLCLASAVISVTSLLNFSLAATLAVLLGAPLSLSTPSDKTAAGLARYSLYVLLGAGWLVLGKDELRAAVWNWEVLGVWFAPFVCIVYTPLVLQAGIVCLLPP